MSVSLCRIGKLHAVLAVAIMALVSAPLIVAEDHAVKRADLHQALVAASQVRQTNLAKVEKFLSSAPIKDVLKKAKVDAGKIQKAVPLLTDEELVRLAAQAEKIQNDFAAGALSNQELTYIVIALVAAVVVLIAVAA